MAANANKSYIAGIGLKGSNGAVIEDNIPIVVDYRNVIVDFGVSTKRLDDILFGAYDEDGHQIGLYTSISEKGAKNPMFDPQTNSFFQYWKNQKDRWEQLIVKYENEWEPFKIERSNGYTQVKANDGVDDYNNNRALSDQYYCLEIGRRPNLDNKCLFNIGTANDSLHTQSGMWYRMDQFTDDTGYLGLRSLSNDNTDKIEKLGNRSTLRFFNGGGFGNGFWDNHFFAVWGQDTNPANVAMTPNIDGELYVGTQTYKFKEMNSIKLNIGARPAAADAASTEGIEVWKGGIYLYSGGIKFGQKKDVTINYYKTKQADGTPHYNEDRIILGGAGMTIAQGGLAILNNGLRVWGGEAQFDDAVRIRKGMWMQSGGMRFGGESPSKYQAVINYHNNAKPGGGYYYSDNRVTLSGAGMTIGQGGLGILEGGFRVWKGEARFDDMVTTRNGLWVYSGGLQFGGTYGQPTNIITCHEDKDYGNAQRLTIQGSVTIQDGNGLAIKHGGLRVWGGEAHFDDLVQIRNGLWVYSGGLQFGGTHKNPTNVLSCHEDADYGGAQRLTLDGAMTIRNGNGLAIKNGGLRVFDSGIRLGDIMIRFENYNGQNGRNEKVIVFNYVNDDGTMDASHFYALCFDREKNIIRIRHSGELKT